jgi:hypothetical protein
VSRPGGISPFNDPLPVVEVHPPTATRIGLPANQALAIGETYCWGLQVEAATGVLRSGDGRDGARFVVASAIPPSGGLLEPPNNTVVADDTTALVLRWSADSGSCGATLSTRLLLTRLGDETGLPDWDQAQCFDVPPGEFEVDLADVVDLATMQGGSWAWAIETNDGAETFLLQSSGEDGRTYRAFVRNTAPRFTYGPVYTHIVCMPEFLPGVAFGYEDDNGLDLFAIRFTYSADPNNVFTTPTAGTQLDSTPSDPEFVHFTVCLGPFDMCMQFPSGPGTYGIELDDGVNPPVRAAVAVLYEDCNGNTMPDFIDQAMGGYPDCNGNDVLDVCDIAAGSSQDLNENLVPDECEGGGA